VVAKESDNTSLDYLLGVNPDGRFRFITQGLANDAVAPTASVFDGKRWYHVVGVQDPATNRVRLFVNGVQVASVARAASGVTSSGPLLIGDRSSGNQVLNGRIDEVAIYRRALSAAEIVAHYQAGTNSMGALAGLIGTSLQTSMQDVNASVYARISFQVDDVAVVDTLTLRMRYDDGFVAYLNGVEVARRNAPASPSWNSSATVSRTGLDPLQAESIDLSAFVGLLRTGRNLLAFHGLNVSADDSDFLVLPELEASLLYREAHQFFSVPTPGQANGPGYPGWVADTKFSVDRGFYDVPFQVAITCATPGVVIRYTTNSSAPNETNGFVYAGPVPVIRSTTLRAAAFYPGFIPANVDTHTYLFTNDVIRQPTAPPGFPPTWNGTTPDYAMDPGVVNMPQTYTVHESLRAIPTLAISASIADVFGPDGVYSNPVQQGELWERPASAELILPDGSTAFQIDCGFEVQGAASRLPDFTPKHSFKVVFKRQYGATKLKHRIFPDSDLAKFDSLTLRAFYTDAWVANRVAPDRFRPEDAQYQRDLWMKDTHLAMGQLAGHNIYVHLYVCGLYWGLYNVSERPDAFFNAEYRGGTKEDYDVIKDYQEVQAGDLDAFNTMFNIVNRPTSDPRHVGTPAGYAELEQYLDVPALIDYMMLHIYAAAEDWPTHNWYAGRRRAPGAKYLFYVWDQEIGLDTLTRDRSTVSDNRTPAGLYAQLRTKSADFRMLFADRIQKHMFNDGPLTPARNIARYLGRSAQIDKAVVA